jgi:hypothetical protein
MSRKMRRSAAIALALLMTSIAIMTTVVQAQLEQETAHGGYTEGMPGGSTPLPAGKTPDVSYPTLAYISFRPNPIGVGQSLLVNVWMQPPIHVARYFNKAFQVTFTKPDGTTDVVGPFNSYYGDATSWFEYTVDTIGTWKVKFDFLGAYFPPGNYTSLAAFTINQTLNAPLGVYYQPSSDGPYNLVVQQSPAGRWPTVPLPTDYWTRPASHENRDWWPILGNYPSTGIVGGGLYWPADTNTYMNNYNFIPYVQAPNSAHIVWKQARADGGLIGGTLGQGSYTNAGSGFTMIYNGRAYGTLTKPGSGATGVTYWQCYDIRTGQLLWERPLATGESAPNLLSYTTRTISAVPGDIASDRNLGVELMYVGGGRMLRYDPWTGTVNLNISIAPLSTGTFYANSLSAPLFLTVQTLGSGANTQYRLINWTMIGDIGYPDITNKRLGVISNISWPFSSLGTVDYESNIAVNTVGVTPSSTGVTYGYRIIGVSMATGQVLWNVSTDVTKGYEGFFSPSTQIADHGKFAVRLNDGTWRCWDIRTGQQLWVSEMSSHPWGIWGVYGESSAYGLLIYPQYDGVVAYNWTNGKVAWRYKYDAPYPYETVYADDNTGEALYPFYDSIIRIADGKVYTSNTEHTASQPATRGWKLHCINATTGEGLWNITGSMAAGAVADGYLQANNRNDGFLYVFGKGKSATTVTAPQTAVSKGNAVLIEGTVLDQSPAQPGTPAVSKESMATQMEYLHMQKPIDGVEHNLTITGVPVLLTAIGSDGSVTSIGTVTTNGYYGTFSKEWTPPAEGTYQIIASFAGDDSYGSSSAGTGLLVGPAPVTTPTPEAPVIPDYTLAIVGAAIVVIIAVAIATLLILRKK